MTFNVFTIKVKEKVQEVMGVEYLVGIEEVLKNNSQSRKGLVIREKEEGVTPTIYLEEYFVGFEEGELFDDVIQRLLETYESARANAERYQDIKMELADCQERIIYRLVSKSKNSELLKSSPHLPFLDLAIIFNVLHEDSEEGIETVRVTNHLLKYWDLSVEELYDFAQINTRRLFPPKIQSIEEVLKELLDMEGADLNQGIPMIVMTNTRGVNGATTILYDNVIRTIAKEMNCDFYIIPSSVHELLLIPFDETVDLEQLNQVVNDVNQTQVEPEDILGDNVYFYCKESDTIKV